MRSFNDFKEEQTILEGNAFGEMVQKVTALRDEAMEQLKLSKEEAQEMLIKTLTELK